MNAWTSSSLADLGVLRNGVNFNQGQEGLGLPVVKVKDFQDRVLVPKEGLDELNPNAMPISELMLIQPGDTLIIRSNGNGDMVGRCLYVDATQRPTTFSGFCIRFRPNPDVIHPRFASYLLRSSICRDPWVAFGSGTGIQNINQDIIGRTKVEIPDLGIQAAIAGLLGVIDDKIELNRKMNRTLAEMVHGLFRSWFVDFDPVIARREGRLPLGIPDAVVADIPERFEDSDQGPMPTGWFVKQINDLVSIHRDSINPQSTSAEMFDHYSIPAFDNGGGPVIEPGLQIQSQKYLVPEECVLLSKLNPSTPRVWLPTNRSDRRKISSTEFMVLKPHAGVSLEFLYALLSSDQMVDELTGLANGTSNSHQRVKPPDFLRIKTVMPGLSLVEAFTQLVQPWMKASNNNSKESHTLATLRDTLIDPLLIGDLSLKECERRITEVL